MTQALRSLIRGALPPDIEGTMLERGHKPVTRAQCRENTIDAILGDISNQDTSFVRLNLIIMQTNEGGRERDTNDEILF